MTEAETVNRRWWQGLAITALVLGITAFFPGCCLAGFYGNWIWRSSQSSSVMGMKGAGSGMATSV